MTNTEVQNNPIYLADLEVITTDLKAANILLDKCNHSEDINARCSIAFLIVQAIEKSYRAMIRIDSPEIFNQKNENGLRYIHTTHDLLNLRESCEKTRSGISKENPFITKNEYKLSHFNNLRFGTRRIELEELYELKEAAEKMVNKLYDDYIRTHPIEELTHKISDKCWETRHKTNFRIPDEIDDEAVKRSMSGCAINQKDHDVINSMINVADTLLKEAYTQNDRYLLCLSGAGYGDALFTMLNAIVKADDPAMYESLSKDPSKFYNETHNIKKVMDIIERTRPGFKEKYAYFLKNAIDMERISGLRYGRESTTFPEIRSLALVVKSLANELENDYLNEHPDPKINKKNTYEEWQNRKGTDLKSFRNNKNLQRA